MNEYEQYKFLLEDVCKFKEAKDEDYFYLVYEDSDDSSIIMVARFSLIDKKFRGIYLADAINNIEDF